MEIVDFYRGRATDHAGRWITDIWRFDARELEERHDFIQWLFPLEVASPVNPLAPVLDVEAQEAFRGSPELRERMLRSLDVMLGFYGFERAEMNILLLAEFPVRAENWLQAGNHNHLRLTRILHCLTLCGLEREAEALLARLEEVAKAHPGAVSGRTLAFWRGAVAKG